MSLRPRERDVESTPTCRTGARVVRIERKSRVEYECRMLDEDANGDGSLWREERSTVVAVVRVMIVEKAK